MKKLFILLLATCFYPPLFSQSFWERAHGPQGIAVKTVQYDPQGNIYATDSDKRTYRSADYGLNWKEIHGPDLGVEIRRLQVGYKGTLFCFGADWLKLYRSKDFGETWELVPGLFLNKPFTEGPDGGFITIADNAIIRTFDDVNWDTLAVDSGYWPWNNLFLELGWLPDGTLVASQNGCYDPSEGSFYLISSDNGSTWDTLPGAGPVAYLASLGNGSYIFSCDDDFRPVYRTSVGGSSTVTALPMDAIDLSTDSYVVTASGNIIGGDYFQNQISHDGGETWQTYTGNIFSSFSRRALPGNLILGGRGFTGAIMRSTDEGQTWKFSAYGAENSWVHDWTFKGTDKAFALAASGLWRTLDARQSWHIVPPDSSTTKWEIKNYNMTLSPGGDLYLCRASHLLRSTDNGETYEDISPDTSFGKFGRIAVNPQTGDLYLSGDSLLLKSSDTGQNWQLLNSDIPFAPQPLVFHPSSTFYAIAFKNGTGRRLVRSDDGGISWQEVLLQPEPNNGVDNVVVAPDGRVIATNNGAYFSSSDNGNSWVKHFLPYNGAFSLAVNAAGDAYVSGGSNRKIYKTTDDGASWSALPEIPSSIYSGIVSLAFDNSQRLWVCTDGDGHFRTTETTVSTSQPKPVASALEIFPNPALDGFLVKWNDENSSSSPVTLRLRDFSGRMVLQQTLSGNPAYVAAPAGSSGVFWVELICADRCFGAGKVILGD